MQWKRKKLKAAVVWDVALCSPVDRAVVSETLDAYAIKAMKEAP